MYYLGVECTVIAEPWVVYINLSKPLPLAERNALREMVRKQFADQFGAEDIPILIA